MKNLNKNTKYFLITIIILIFNSCKEKDCRKDGTCPPDYRKMPLGEAKNYLWSLPGSYWIYKNTATGDLDTQICTGFKCDTIISKGDIDNNRTKHITIEYERIARTITSSFNKLEYYDETAGYSANSPRNLGTGLDRFAFINSSTIFVYPFETTNEVEIVFLGVDSTFLIQGIPYINVAKFQINIDGIVEKNCQQPAMTTTYYWAKNVGLLKKSVKNCNYSWELIKCNIIK